jgi:hypothetical protein
VTGLTTGTEYAFAVTAWNATGQSDPSNCVVKTTAQVPAAPAALLIGATTMTTVALSWTNPSGGGLSANTIYYVNGTTCSGTMFSLPLFGAPGTGRVSGLAAGMPYAFDVTAWNATGQSRPSACETTTTVAPPPVAPGSGVGSALTIALVGVGIVVVAAAVAVVVLLRRRKGAPPAPSAAPPRTPARGATVPEDTAPTTAEGERTPPAEPPG